MSRMLALAPLVLALACGPGSVSDGDTTTETTTETTAGDGIGETGETGGCSSFEATVAALEAPEQCESYFQDFPTSTTNPTHGLPPNEVEVEIINDRADPILLREQGLGCHHLPRWFLLDGEFQGHSIWLPASNCVWEWPSCESLVVPDSCLLCQTEYWPIYIAPGGRFRTTWPAAVLIEVELPGSCSADGEPTACWAPTPLPLGEYQVRAIAAPLGDCDECTCEVDEHGSCAAPSFPSEPTTLSASATWTASCDPIELRFEG